MSRMSQFEAMNASHASVTKSSEQVNSNITLDSPIENEYDYIIAGGGTSGSVVAARLAESDPSLKVLVIEAGQHNSLLENTLMVGGWSKNFDAPTDWNIETVPNAGLNNRQVKASRGKFLGGSSGCNGTLCIRGTKQDYDDWNLPGWSGDNVWSYMKKAENFHTKEWFNQDVEAHGTTGKLNVEPHDLAPISNLLLESMESMGLPRQDDMFTSGNNPHGCGHAPRTVFKGDRTTSADYLVGLGENLTIMTETTVDKVVLEKGSADDGADLKATGVVVIDKEGRRSTIKAKREIVISGGAYCSPTILLRSGIGSKKELEKHDIACQVDLPGVGKNLQDHLIVFIFYETEKAGLTNDHLLYHGDVLGEAYRQWKEEKRGPLSTFPFGAFAYARLDERLKDDEGWMNAARAPGRDPMGLTPQQPNIEFFTTECYGGPKQYADYPLDSKYAFSIIAELFSPRSRGTVKLDSADPLANPVVDHNYLADPLDLTVLTEACAFGNEIVMNGKGTKDIVHGAWPKSLTHHKHTHRDDWKEYVKNHATTCYHPGGTCKMSSRDDPMGVLDSELRVRGVSNLRVADTSVMPTLNQGHTQMPAYAIGEHAAELLLAPVQTNGAQISSLIDRVKQVVVGAVGGS